MYKKFIPVAQPDTKAAEDAIPNVKVRKWSAHQYQTGPVPGQGEASAPGYNFTGVTPGSESICIPYGCIPYGYLSIDTHFTLSFTLKLNSSVALQLVISVLK